MDAVDIAIVGTVMMCIGFAAGIIITAKSPKKDLRDISEISEDAMHNAAELVEKFRKFVDSAIDTENGLYCSREKNIANAKECALIAVDLLDKGLMKNGIDSGDIDKLKKAIERYDG